MTVFLLSIPLRVAITSHYKLEPNFLPCPTLLLVKVMCDSCILEPCCINYHFQNATNFYMNTFKCVIEDDQNISSWIIFCSAGYPWQQEIHGMCASVSDKGRLDTEKRFKVISLLWVNKWPQCLGGFLGFYPG